MHSKEVILVGELCTTVALTGAALVDSLSPNNPERTIFLIIAATLIGVDATILAPRRIIQISPDHAKLRKIEQSTSESEPLAE